jgi:DNA-binding NtrC family response regulator
MSPVNQNISVMVIDDDQMVLSSMLDFLDDVGFNTTGFTEPEEALTMMKANPPDVCIVDLRMPGMNGEQLLKEILTIDSRVRCLIHTGSFYRISDDLKALGMSQEDVIQKPVHDFEILSEKLRAGHRLK